MSNRYIDLEFDYPEILHGYGLPFRLQDRKPFSIKDKLKQFTIDNETTIINVNKQHKWFTMACKANPGWFMYVVANGVLDPAKHIAANIMMHYVLDSRKVKWVSSFDKLEAKDFVYLDLVVIDALFFDSSNYRRDKIYEIVNHHCNKKDLSVIVIGQHSDPLAMQKQLGMNADFVNLVK